jgi:hypothetical protein
MKSMTTSKYVIFEHITLDIIHLNRKSCRGYKYSALFVDKCSTKIFAYYLKRKCDLVTAFKRFVIIATSNERKRPRVKFKKTEIYKTLDLSLPLTPTKITEA